MNKLIFRYIFKQERWYFIIHSIIVTISYCLISFIFYNEKFVYSLYGGEEYVPSKDINLIQCLGLENIERQSYIFSFAILVIILIIYFITWGYFSSKKHQSNISLMRVKGIRKMDSQFTFLIMRNFLFLIFSAVALFPYILFLLLFFLITGSQHMIIIPTYWVILFIIVYDLLFLFISLPYYSIPYKNKYLIKFIRENY